MTIAICRRVAKGTGTCPHPTNCTCFPPLYDYKGHQIVSNIVSSETIPAQVSVKVWKAGANHLHDVPVYFCLSLDQAMKWVDQGARAPAIASALSQRMLPCWH
jgi:hypothetical protein